MLKLRLYVMKLIEDVPTLSLVPSCFIFVLFFYAVHKKKLIMQQRRVLWFRGYRVRDVYSETVESPITGFADTG